MRFILFVLLLVRAFQPDLLIAFPENVRHGYLSCSSCHISPSGGGVLTPYGRAQSSAFMSSFSFKGEEQPLYGLGFKQLPEFLSLGGDVRYVNVSLDGEAYHATRKFVMQTDLEIAVMPIRGVTLAISGGLYGEKRVREYRRNFIKLDVTDNVSFRAGRFTPAYGIAFPDHRLPTRAGLGLGEGSETNNLEGALVTTYGEVIVTGVWGSRSDVALGKAEGYELTGDMIGSVARAALYLGTRTQLGISGLRLSSDTHYRRSYGGFIMTGFTDTLYLMAECDLKDEDEVKTTVATLKLGAEFLRGFHTSIVGDVNDKAKAAGFQIQWLPTPHLELVGEMKRNQSEAGTLDSKMIMLHYYL